VKQIRIRDELTSEVRFKVGAPKYNDREHGWPYLRARVYDAEIGGSRWAQWDVLPPEARELADALVKAADAFDSTEPVNTAA
jgi:hypothetical protein